MKFISYLLSLLVLLLFSCSDDETKSEIVSKEVKLTNLSEIKDSKGFTYKVGFDQASSNNQNPIVTKFDSSGKEVWKKIHESTPVDGRAILIAIDKMGIPWVVFVVDGGSNDSKSISKKEIESNAFKSVYMPSYGRGGGAKVSILAKLNPQNGKISKATFITSRLNSGKTNSFTITSLGFKDDLVSFTAKTAAWPPGSGKKYKKMPNITDNDRKNGSFMIQYDIKNNLSEIITAKLK